MSQSRCAIALVLLAAGSSEAAASEGGGLGEQLIRPQIGTFVWTLLTFIIMLVILGRYAWKPLLGALAAREASIQGSLEQARREREEAASLLEQQRELVTQARRERAEALALGRRDAEKLKAELLEEAGRQREQLLRQAEGQIEASMRQARNELRGIVADLAIGAAEKLLARNLDDAAQRRLVEEHLADLERTSQKSQSVPS